MMNLGQKALLMLGGFGVVGMILAALPGVAQTSMQAGASSSSGSAGPAERPTAQPRADRKPLESMMFAGDELSEIRLRAAGAGDSQSKAKPEVENANLYLSTILYTGPKDWTIWINGIPVGPHQDFQTFQVTSITRNSVELLVPLSVQGMRPIKLGPNQTYIGKSGVVVEGQAP